jgi:hypothetical protein
MEKNGSFNNKINIQARKSVTDLFCFINILSNHGL